METPMRFLILINANPHAFEGMTQEQLRAFGRRRLACRTGSRTRASYQWSSEGWPTLCSLTSLAVRDGQTLTTDGPFAETKEHLAGFI
jgi:hypothetical protein